MGMSLSSVHIFAHSAPDCGYEFRSFSEGWQTCLMNFWEKDPDFPQKLAKYLSGQTSAPVLHFAIFDSDCILLEIYTQGKLAARFCDSDLISNKKLYDIPGLLGLPEGQKRRLSGILGCSDVEFKTQMLSEYLGLRLLVEPWMAEAGVPMPQPRTDVLFREYQQQERSLTGKAALFALKKQMEISGQLHTALYGGAFAPESRHLAENILMEHQTHMDVHGGPCPTHWLDHHFYLETRPDGKRSVFQRVLFTDGQLKPVEYDLYPFRERGTANCLDPRFREEYRDDTDRFTLTFSADCPPAWAGRTIVLPRGVCYYRAFSASGELLLQIGQRLYVLEPEEKIVAKLPIKGCIVDIQEDYILSDASVDSAEYFDPRNRLLIYRLVHK